MDTTGLIASEKRSLVRLIRRNAKLLGQLRIPAALPYLSDEHREATLAAWKAGDLFDKLVKQYPL